MNNDKEVKFLLTAMPLLASLGAYTLGTHPEIVKEWKDAMQGK